jgi:hypothetical protein
MFQLFARLAFAVASMLQPQAPTVSPVIGCHTGCSGNDTKTWATIPPWCSVGPAEAVPRAGTTRSACDSGLFGRCLSWVLCFLRWYEVLVVPGVVLGLAGPRWLRHSLSRQQRQICPIINCDKRPREKNHLYMARKRNIRVYGLHVYQTVIFTALLEP